MKRIFTLFILFSTGTASFAQRLLTEDFNYSTGELTATTSVTGAPPGANVSGGTWISASGTTNAVQVTAGSLTYPNYNTNPTAGSNKITILNTAGSSEDPARDFSPQVSGTVYMSFLFKLTSTNVTALAPNSSLVGEYFASLSQNALVTSYISRVYIRQGVTANTVNFGISAVNSGTTPVVWIPLDYSAATTHLITTAYTFVAGASNDISKLWVDPAYSATEPIPMAASVLLTGTEALDAGYVVFRQNGALSPNADIDAVKVSTSYLDAALPLSLTSFNAAFNGKSTQVKWSTANELNVSGFNVEKSLNGKEFSNIGFEAAKNNALQNNYSFDDNNVKAGANYYRLRIMDKDGSAKYSPIVVVNNKSAINAEIYPNPATNSLTVSHPKAASASTISIFNAEGKQVKIYSVQAGNIQTGISISDLAKGNYVLIFENEGSRSTTKFVKQ